ncbi:MAG: DUF4293 family protein, partial [Ferruginibacter sp.]|nr:DUF4293 family protein [Ferruginibacter sp.]
EITVIKPKTGDQISISVNGKKFEQFTQKNTADSSTYTFTFPPQTTAGTKLMATSNWYLMTLTLLSVIGSFIAIFLYHNRKIQIRVNIAALVISSLLLFIYIFKSFGTSGSIPSLTCLLYLSIPFVLYLSMKGISSDQKLVQDSDRLR